MMVICQPSNLLLHVVQLFIKTLYSDFNQNFGNDPEVFVSDVSPKIL